MVVETGGALTYIGRFDTEDEAGVHLLNVGVHDAADDETLLDAARACPVDAITVIDEYEDQIWPA